jgi:hypothetical protein
LKHLPRKTVHHEMSRRFGLLVGLLWVLTGCTHQRQTAPPPTPPLAETSEQTKHVRAKVLAELERMREPQPPVETLKLLEKEKKDSGEREEPPAKTSVTKRRARCMPGDPLCSFDDDQPDYQDGEMEQYRRVGANGEPVNGRGAARVDADVEPPDGVLRAVRANYGRMEACVPRARRDRRHELSVSLMLDGYGSFREVRVRGSELDSATTACIEDVFHTMHVADAAGERRIVTLPLWIRAAQ